MILLLMLCADSDDFDIRTGPWKNINGH